MRVSWFYKIINDSYLPCKVTCNMLVFLIYT